MGKKYVPLEEMNQELFTIGGKNVWVRKAEDFLGLVTSETYKAIVTLVDRERSVAYEIGYEDGLAKSKYNNKAYFRGLTDGRAEGRQMLLDEQEAERKEDNKIADGIYWKQK